MKITIFCVACGEACGVADTDTLRLPLNGSMFDSYRPENGFPAPFAMDKTRLFGDLRCPVCKNNATEEDAVMTTEGRYVVPQPSVAEITHLEPAPINQGFIDAIAQHEQEILEVTGLTPGMLASPGPEGSNGVPEDSRSCICSKCSKELKDYRGRLAHERRCRA
jgi:hypothetical protein